jgi:hypothetical protein
MKKPHKIRVLGSASPRDTTPTLKFFRYGPIRAARVVFNTPCKEVRIMDVGGLEIQSTNFAEQMKDIRKVRLQRQVMENPEMARELVKVEASGTYNAKGDVIQAVTGDLGDA